MITKIDFEFMDAKPRGTSKGPSKVGQNFEGPEKGWNANSRNFDTKFSATQHNQEGNYSSLSSVPKFIGDQIKLQLWNITENMSK